VKEEEDNKLVVIIAVFAKKNILHFLEKRRKNLALDITSGGREKILHGNLFGHCSLRFRLT
jgi:hypothetical protein